MFGALGRLPNRATKGTRRGHEKKGARNSFQIKVKEWCRRGESNPRPRDYETLALPLSYAGTKAIVYATELVTKVSSIPTQERCGCSLPAKGEMIVDCGGA